MTVKASMPEKGAVLRYFHREIPALSGGFLGKGNVQIGEHSEVNLSQSMEIALIAMRLASRLSIQFPTPAQDKVAPYSPGNDSLVFRAPLTSATVNKKILFLRGWKAFDSCVKGFNSLGLMADQVFKTQKKLKTFSSQELFEAKMEFLGSRLALQDHSSPPAKPLAPFSKTELSQLNTRDLIGIDLFDLSIWQAFAKKTIVCSTSSNMGISLHQALRLMQKTVVRFKEKSFHLLNPDEGKLIIWCPDERADFMNAEKTFLLQSLEKEEPATTRLRTYINRQQRDPGALGDALRSGGYFFPTNPQSQDEMQNLIFVALKELATEKGTDPKNLLQERETQETLASLDSTIRNDVVYVNRGVEGGIYGLMIPYLILLEEYLEGKLGEAVSTWNQASIGAALAAAVIADQILRNPMVLEEHTRAEFNSIFPALSKFLDTHRIGKDLKTEIHGVFDIANLQSLAQLLGVVVQKHMSGRGTAFVGLGSSSYSNGNRCFEILLESSENKGAFRGKSAFHPATHTMNPFAQAMIFGEDLYRFLNLSSYWTPLSEKQLSECFAHVRKPEPAGAAALAGYLLARLDDRTLSAIEIAYMLKLVGFSSESFLEFAGYGVKGKGLHTFLQGAFEEGPAMSGFAQDLMVLLDWQLKDLETQMLHEKNQSKLRYWQSPMDDLEFEHVDNSTCLYLTGDNTGQPSPSLMNLLIQGCQENRSHTEAFITQHANPDLRKQLSFSVNLACHVLHRVNKYGNAVNQKMDSYSKRLIHQLVSRNVDS